jgi:hypothetical protein
MAAILREKTLRLKMRSKLIGDNFAFGPLLNEGACKPEMNSGFYVRSRRWRDGLGEFIVNRCNALPQSCELLPGIDHQTNSILWIRRLFASQE